MTSIISIDNEQQNRPTPHSIHDDEDSSSNNNVNRGNLFSMFSCIVRPTTRMQQRLSFRNRWKKKRVKFDPKFHFIISQLIVKDVLKADGILYPDSPSDSKSSKKSKKLTKAKKKSLSNASDVTIKLKDSPSMNDNDQPQSSMDNGTSTSNLSSSMSSSTDNNSTTSSNNKGTTDFEICKPCTNNMTRKQRCPTNETEISLLSTRCLDCTDRCPICWEGYKVGEKVCWSKNGKCNHAFHFDCIVTWLVDNDDCPMCRSPYLTKKKEKVEDEGGSGSGSDDNGRNINRNRALVRLRRNGTNVNERSENI